MISRYVPEPRSAAARKEKRIKDFCNTGSGSENRAVPATEKAGKGMNRQGSERRRALYEAILQLDSYEQCTAFFDDLCTKKELESMEQRFEVARMLQKNKVYMDIMQKTRASSATISRVKRMLADGTGVLGSMITKLDGNGKTD